MSISFALTPRRARGRFSGEMSAASSRANTSSKKGVMRSNPPSSRQVVVRGFENLAQGDSTLFRPDTSVGEAPVRAPSTDELYLAAAREATRQLQEQNSSSRRVLGDPCARAPALPRELRARIAGLLSTHTRSRTPPPSTRPTRSPRRANPPRPRASSPPPTGAARRPPPCATRPPSVFPRRRPRTRPPPRPPGGTRARRDDPRRRARRVGDPFPPSAPRVRRRVRHARGPRQVHGDGLLALVAKNIAIDAVVVETERSAREVVSLSPKTSEDLTGSADAEREPEARLVAKPEPEPVRAREPTARDVRLVLAGTRRARARRTRAFAPS